MSNVELNKPEQELTNNTLILKEILKDQTEFGIIEWNNCETKISVSRVEPCLPCEQLVSPTPNERETTQQPLVPLS